MQKHSLLAPGNIEPSCLRGEKNDKEGLLWTQVSLKQMNLAPATHLEGFSTQES